MAKPGTFSYYKELPGWAKGIIVIAVMAVIAFLAYTIYKAIKRVIDVQKAKDTLNAATTQRAALESSGVRASYTDVQYKSWANALQVAMNSTFGTDEAAIEAIILKMQNDVDLFKLIEAFGVRTVKTPLWGDDTNGDLGQCLNAELDDTEMADLNKNLRDNGITFQF